MKRLILGCAVLCLAGACVDDLTEEPTTPERNESTTGDISLEWSIEGAGEAISCLDAKASRVIVVATSPDVEISETLSCLNGFGTTGPLDAGDFDVEVHLTNADGETVDSVAIGAISILRGETTPLGRVDFIIE